MLYPQGAQADIGSLPKNTFRVGLGFRRAKVFVKRLRPWCATNNMLLSAKRREKFLLSFQILTFTPLLNHHQQCVSSTATGIGPISSGHRIVQIPSLTSNNACKCSWRGNMLLTNYDVGVRRLRVAESLISRNFAL